MSPLLSIIIPYYNTADSLKKLLLSIGNPPSTQVIVVNDHSTKNLELYEALKKQFDYVTFLDNPGVQSAGAARNVGIDHAEGKWFLFADADDYFLDGWYEAVSQYFDNTEDLIFFPPTSVDLVPSRDIPRHQYFYNLCKNYILKKKNAEQQLRIEWPAPWSKLIRADVVRNHNIRFSEVLHCNDLVFSTHVGVLASSITVSEKPIYCVTRTLHSLTATESPEATLIRVTEWRKGASFLRDHGFPYVKTDPTAYITQAWLDGFGFRFGRKLRKLFGEYKIPVLTIALLDPRFIGRGLRKAWVTLFPRKRKITGKA